MGMGEYRTARELHHRRRPELSENADRFYYKEEQIFEKPFDWDQLKRLGTYLLPYTRQVVLAGVAMVAATLTRLAVPWLIAQTIDAALETEVRFTVWTRWLEPFGRTERLAMLVGVMLLVHLINWLANYARIRLTNWVGQKALFDLRTRIFTHVQSLSMRFFDTRPAGSILVRITNDVNSLEDLFTNGIISVLQDLLTLVGIIAIMMSMHLQLSLVVFLFLPLMVFVTGRLRTRVRHGWQLVRIKRSRITAHLAEAIQGVRVTQTFCQEEENKDFFSDMNADNRYTWLAVQRQNAWFMPIVEITSALATAAVYWYGTRVLQTGAITVGVLVAFATYVGQFWEPINRLTQMYGNILVAMASSERIFEYLDTEPTVPEKPEAVPLPPIRGKVELENVVFAYEEGRTALNGVSLKVEPGETVALVGHTGAGKTSIINLLSRFYDVNEGAVRIDGIDVRDVTLESLRRQIAVVLQETFIFSGTIMDNIRFGRLDATDEEVMAAARLVSADAVVARLPKGYHEPVGEGGDRLSAGEKQLISLARAVLADPPIFVLDEATASVDTETEQLIQRAIAQVLKGRTSFIIAHRLSTIRNADMILVMKDGDIIESGNHHELLAKGGFYAELYNSQFEQVS